MSAAKKQEDPQKLKTLEARLQKLDGAKLGGRVKHYETNALGVSSFPGWLREARETKDPDLIRNALYYGFQPLFDALADKTIDGAARTRRPQITAVLDHLIRVSVDFLAGYYSGEPDVKIFQKGLSDGHPWESLESIPYRTKFRNVDANGVYPSGIQDFLRNFLIAAVDRTIFVPDYVVGCACGSSEVAMPLAGLVGAPVDFLRRSKRRSDSKVKIIAEQEERIKTTARDARVVCVEDYVCTGHSLRSVMDQVKDFGAQEVRGASVCDSHEGSYVHRDQDRENFRLYSFP